MTIAGAEKEIVEEFALLDSWELKYEYLIDMGKDLPKMDEVHKVDEHLIKGCQSRVWLHTRFEDGKLHYEADSDAIITKGIIALLIRILNHKTPEEIANAPLHFIEEIGLHTHLSPTRSNGLTSMIKQMKIEALTLKNTSA